MKRPSKAFALSALLAFSVSHADPGSVALGVQGTTFPIDEPDIRAVIAYQVKNADLKGKQDRLVDQAKHYGENLSDFVLPVPDHTQTYYITPQAQVAETIYYPDLDDDGVLVWKVLAEKGTTVNPLERHQPTDAFFIFNGNDPEQVRFMKSLLAAAPEYIRPLASAGDPTSLAAELNQPIYRASPFLLKRFDLSHEPALVRAGDAGHEKQLAVTVFAPPFSIKSALNHVERQQLLGSNEQ